MREIVKVLLEKGIDEETIHEVLDILEGEKVQSYVKAKTKKAQKDVEAAQKAYEENPTKKTYNKVENTQGKLEKLQEIGDTAEATKIKGETKGTNLANKETGKPRDFKSEVWRKRMEREMPDVKKVGYSMLSSDKYNQLPDN